MHENLRKEKGIQSDMKNQNSIMSSSDVGDRLSLLRDNCVSKYKHLDEIMVALKRGEDAIEEIRRNFPVQSSICKMRVALAEKQENHAIIVETIENEKSKHENLQIKTKIVQDDLKVYTDKYVKLAEKVSHEKKILAIHDQLALDTLNMIQEQYLMSKEEIFAIAFLIDDVEIKSKTSNRVDWLKKIIRATQIQRKEDESSLAYIENEHSKLTQDSANNKLGYRKT